MYALFSCTLNKKFGRLFDNFTTQTQNYSVENLNLYHSNVFQNYILSEHCISHETFDEITFAEK